MLIRQYDGVIRLAFISLFMLAVSGTLVLMPEPALAVKRPIAIQGDTVMAPVKLPDGQVRRAEVTIFIVIPDAKFVEAACAYRSTVREAALYVLETQPMSLEDWGELERGSQDARLSLAIKPYVRREWITRVHAVAGPRARPIYTVWYENVRVLKCSDWDRWKKRKPPPPPPFFIEPIFKQFR